MSNNKIKKTKLEVFNIGNKLSFDVNTPQFLKEGCENCNKGMYSICWNIFQNLLAQVAERALEIGDPILDTLMIRLNLYEIPNEKRYKIIASLKEKYEKLIKSN